MVDAITASPARFAHAGRPLDVAARARDDVRVVTQEIWLDRRRGDGRQIVGDVPGDRTRYRFLVPTDATSAHARIRVVARRLGSVQRAERTSDAFRIEAAASAAPADARPCGVRRGGRERDDAVMRRRRPLAAASGRARSRLASRSASDARAGGFLDDVEAGRSAVRATAATRSDSAPASRHRRHATSSWTRAASVGGFTLGATPAALDATWRMIRARSGAERAIVAQQGCASCRGPGRGRHRQPRALPAQRPHRAEVARAAGPPRRAALELRPRHRTALTPRRRWWKSRARAGPAN